MGGTGFIHETKERVLFIGTQFSILYTSMYSPAEAATPRAWCLWFRVSMHTGVHRFLAYELLVNPVSSGNLAFSLRLAPFLPASDSPALHTGSSASPSLAIPNFLGPPPPSFLLTASSDTLASSLRLMPPIAVDEVDSERRTPAHTHTHTHTHTGCWTPAHIHTSDQFQKHDSTHGRLDR